MFIIHPHSKIVDIIKANKDSIQVIAALARPFEKLKNPMLRKLLASRVTVAEAAKIGGCTLSDFARVLHPLGFKFEFAAATGNETMEQQPEWLLNAHPEAIIKIDARPVLAAGNDPLKEILQQYKDLENERILLVINTFAPYPLIKLLEKKKASCFMETISPTVYHTYFLKQPEENTAPTAGAGDVCVVDEQTFDVACRHFPKEQLAEIDVRQLEMPAPMEAILQSLADLREGGALYVYHKRVPVYLLEELADQAYHIYISTYSEADTRLLITKKNSR